MTVCHVRICRRNHSEVTVVALGLGDAGGERDALLHRDIADELKGFDPAPKDQLVKVRHYR